MKKWLDKYQLKGEVKNSLNRTVTCSNCGWSWKLSDGGEDPLTCHKCGGTIKMKHGGELDEYKEKGEVKQSFRNQLLEKNGPIIDETAAPIYLPPNLNYDKVRVVNGPSAGLNKTQLKNINQNLAYKAEQEKKQELEDYKAAKLFHENNPVAKVLGTRKSKPTLVEPTARELAYGFGAGINNFYDVPNIGIANDFVNPLSLVSKGIISPWAQAPLQAQQSDSYFPYLGAAVSTALTLPMVRPASIATKTFLNPRNIYKGALKTGAYLNKGVTYLENAGIKTSVAPEIKQGLTLNGFSFKPNFKSEINWNNWNKEIPKNTQLMKEYNAIEQTSKANNTWMKNPDGSAFKGTPEQFVQQNSQNFKNAFSNTKFKNKTGDPMVLHHGHFTDKDFSSFLPSKRSGISNSGYEGDYSFFTPHKSLAEDYAGIGMVDDIPGYKSHVKSVYINSKNPLLDKRTQFADIDIPKSLRDKHDAIAASLNPNEFSEVAVPYGNNVKSATGNNGMFDMTNPNIYKAVIPAVLGVGALNQKQEGGAIVTNRGQWDYPGQTTIIPSNEITMRGVSYPVLGVDNTGYTQMMQPGMNYTFPGQYVTEYPMAQNGKEVKKDNIRQAYIDAYNNYSKRKFPAETLPIRQKAFRTVNPSSYLDFQNYNRWNRDEQRDVFYDPRSEEAWNFYLGLSKPEDLKYIKKSQYRPTINATDQNYYALDPELEQDIFNTFKDKVILNKTLQTDEGKVNTRLSGKNGAGALGRFGVSKGHDEKGDYLSYYDRYDLKDFAQDEAKGMPYSIYNRIYYPKKEQGGEMIKRADGSYSKRGLWDNIRANVGSGKRPTKEMLNQERKIRNQHQDGGEEEVNNLKNVNLNLPVYRKPEMNPLSFNKFLVNDKNQNLFIGGINPRYQNENFSVGPYMVGVGNKYFQKFPADMGMSGTYHVNDNFDINMGVGQNNVNAGIKYKFNNGGDVPTVQGTFKKQNQYGYWVTDEEALAKEAQRLNSKRVLTEGGSLIIFDDNWNIVAGDDNPNAPYKQGGSVTLNAGGENHRIYVKTTNRGEGDKGNIMVNHPTMDKGMWDTIDLTKKSGATTIAQGVAATKKWHMENPYMKEYGGDIPMYGPGGFVAKPTASDSLAVMNSQIALNKFYDNEVKQGKLEKDTYEMPVDKNYLKTQVKLLNDKNLEFYRREIAKREQTGSGLIDREYKSIFNLNPSDVSKLEYQGLGKTKSGDANKQYYRDLITPMQNLAAPFALVDSRIKPRAEISYRTPPGKSYPGAAVSVYDYDPIAIKPAAMKTASDWAYVKKMYGTNPPAKVNPNPPIKVKDVVQPKIQGQKLNEKLMQSSYSYGVKPTTNLERIEMVPYSFNNPKVVPHGELLPMPSKQTVDLTNLIEQRTYPIDIYDRKGNFIRKEFMGNSEGVVNPKYIGEHHYAPRGGNSYIDTNYANGGGIPERYKNMGFTNVSAKKQSTRPGKKWMVLAKKGDDYKVVHGGYKGMQDFKQHHSEQRKENFWSRMGGRNSSKATDPFSPLYWHKRFGTWKYGGQPMAVGGQNVMNPIVKKDNRNWLEYLKN